MLFSNIERTDSFPKRELESTFAHLARRAGEDYDQIRELIDEWFLHYPKDHQKEIQRRIQSDSCIAFHSAFLELYIHELLLNLGHRTEVHPVLTCTNKRPDYLAEATDSKTSIFECTVATEESTEERAVQARLDAVYKAINQVHSPDYFLSLSIDGGPETPVPGKRWSRQIQAWLDTLNYDEIAMLGQKNQFKQLPKLELNHDGLMLTVEPIAKKQSSRGKPGVRPIGLQSFEGCWVTSRYEIRNSIRKKATRYGEPKLPYIVIVNCIGIHADSEEIQDAMYGRDGLWSSTTHPSFTRLSGVIAIRHLFPWSVPRADICLFHNPHASYPYKSVLTSLPQARLSNGKVELSDGIHPRETFGLSITWPNETQTN